MVEQVVKGSFTGDAAEKVVEIGFEADVIEVINLTSRVEFKILKGDTVNAFGTTIGATGTKTASASADTGLVISSGVDTTTAKGFKFGATVNVNGNLFQYIARSIG